MQRVKIKALKIHSRKFTQTIFQIKSLLHSYIVLPIYSCVAAGKFLHESAQPTSGTYIHCHPQIDCFVVSQLFSVAWTVTCFKSGVEIRLTLRQTDILIQTYRHSQRQIRDFSIYTLSATWSNQFLRRAIAFQRMAQPANFPARVLNSRERWGHIYVCVRKRQREREKVKVKERETWEIESKRDWERETVCVCDVWKPA